MCIMQVLAYVFVGQQLVVINSMELALSSFIISHFWHWPLVPFCDLLLHDAKVSGLFSFSVCLPCSVLP